MCSKNGSLFSIDSGEMPSSSSVERLTVSFAVSILPSPHAIVEDMRAQHSSSRSLNSDGLLSKSPIRTVVDSAITLPRCALGMLATTFFAKSFERLWFATVSQYPSPLGIPCFLRPCAIKGR